MRRMLAVVSAVALLAAVGTSASARGSRERATALKAHRATASTEYPAGRVCDAGAWNCTETVNPIGYNGAYTGHDEPAVLFYSNTPGSGSSQLYGLTLPSDPHRLPNQSGTAGTFNFQLRPTFWFGLALCDTQSSPNPQADPSLDAPCPANSDTNIFDSPDPADPHYIGLHPGTAFMEMQFYPPGWVAWPDGVSCDATHWCAALNIDSLSSNDNTGVDNNEACLDTIGVEPVNFAFITTSGVADSPGDPLNFDHFTPNLNTDLLMNPSDHLSVDMHDTPDGFQVVINDLTTGQSGSMTTSIPNGFAQVNYDPAATSCTSTPYAFHPMYATSSEHTRVPWAAHTYNVAFSDEIGHFEYCSQADEVNFPFPCTGTNANDPAGIDDDDVFCFGPSDSTRVLIGGCLGTDGDFDGVSYQDTWPGSLSNPQANNHLNPGPVKFTSPLFNGTQNYDRVAFETDLPRIEDQTNPPCQRHVSNPSDPSPGSGCVNPPVGANFYPLFTTRDSEQGCQWQLGGVNIPGTTQTFGGTSTTEFGSLLSVFYAASNGQPQYIYEDFKNILDTNPCPAQRSRR